MSLLTSGQSFSPPSKEQRLTNRASHIKQTVQQVFRQLLDIQHRGINLVWENGDLTPQEIIDALGDDAIKVFQYHAALTDLIKQLATLDGTSVDIKLPTNAFTIANGKITVGTEPYTAS